MGFRILLSILYINFINLQISNCFLVNVLRHSTPFVPGYIRKFTHKSVSYDKETTTKTRNITKISTLEEWKKDLRDMVGVWHIYYPYDLHKAQSFIPNPDIRPSPLIFNLTGQVKGPQNSDSPLGSYLLDSKDYQHLEDENNYIHSRKFIVALRSGLNFLNLRLILAGRVFYSKGNLTPYLGDLVKTRPAIFIGQTFLESFDNEFFEEATTRMSRKIEVLDREGNEINPKKWKPVDFKGVNCPFRWMHGGESWKLIGPFTCYKNFGGGAWDKHSTSLDPFELEKVYNKLDPLELTCKKHTTLDDLHEVVHSVVLNLFAFPNPMAEITIQDEEYLSELEKEMVTLGEKGPDYYRESLE